MTQFVLHIGTNKTGTSTLQHYLGTYRTELLDAGIWYPKVPGNPFAHHSLALSIKENDFGRHGVDPGAIKPTTEDVITVISSEAFHTMNEVGRVAEWFPPESTSVVLYLREHVAYLASWYQQAVQARTITCSFGDFAALRAISFFDLVERWRAVYGDRLHVRVYDRQQLKNKDIVADFFSAGLDRDPPVARTFKDKNPTISGNLLFLKLFMNHFLTPDENTQIVEELSTLSQLAPNFSGKFQIDKDEAARVAHLTAHDRRRLKDEFGIRFKPPREGVSGNRSPDLARLSEDLAVLFAAAKKRDMACYRIFRDKVDLLKGSTF